jgi:hypothetical protein
VPSIRRVPEANNALADFSTIKTHLLYLTALSINILLHQAKNHAHRTLWRQARLTEPTHPLLTSPGICAGKTAIASYLIDEHQFTRLHLARTAAIPAVEKSASNVPVPSPEDSNETEAQHTFDDVDTLLDFVTLRWQERWVTTDILDEHVVDVLLRRPFFLLVSVDAPVTVRWQRFKNRYVGCTGRFYTGMVGGLTYVDVPRTNSPLRASKNSSSAMMPTSSLLAPV